MPIGPLLKRGGRMKTLAKASQSFSRIHRGKQSHSVPVFGGSLASSAVKFVLCTYGARWPSLLSLHNRWEQVFRHISLQNTAPNHYQCTKSIHYKGLRTSWQLANWKWSQAGKRQSGLFNALLKPASNGDIHECACSLHLSSFFYLEVQELTEPSLFN